MPKTNYCVIARRCYNQDRTWASTEKEAIEHAKNLLKRHDQKATEFLVVKAVKVVEIAPPPIAVRNP